MFSPRGATGQWDFKDQPPEFWDQFKTDFPPGTHIRVHPLLHWTEIDIWLYTLREQIPTIPLYFAKDGKRYRSLGDKDITFPVASSATTIEDIIEDIGVGAFHVMSLLLLGHSPSVVWIQGEVAK